MIHGFQICQQMCNICFGIQDTVQCTNKENIGLNYIFTVHIFEIFIYLFLLYKQY